MKNVLHVIYDLSTAGAQTVVMNYMRNMRNDDDYHFTLLVTESFKGSAYEKEIIEGGYDYICCNYRPLTHMKYLRPILNWIRYQYKIWKVINSVKPDIIHSHLTYILPYVAIPAFLSGAKRVHTLHSDPNAISKRYSTWAWIAFHLLGFKPVAVTESQAEKALRRYRLKDISIVHNGLDLEQYNTNSISKQNIRRELGIDSAAFVIGSVGRLDPIKNYPFLLKVFSEYYKFNSKARLLIVGEGVEKQSLHALADTLRIRNRVIFAGQRNDVQNVYKAMDLFMLTSFYESSSIVTVEAQLSGLRCVISSSIPDSVIISKTVNRINLDAPLSDWISAINGDIEPNEVVNAKEIFSLKNTIRELKKVYIECDKSH